MGLIQLSQNLHGFVHIFLLVHENGSWFLSRVSGQYNTFKNIYIFDSIVIFENYFGIFESGLLERQETQCSRDLKMVMSSNALKEYS